MEVVEAQPAERVVWRVADGPEEWIGTTIDWDLRQDGEYTIVLFRAPGLAGAGASSCTTAAPSGAPT